MEPSQPLQPCPRRVNDRPLVDVCLAAYPTDVTLISGWFAKDGSDLGRWYASSFNVVFARATIV